MKHDGYKIVTEAFKDPRYQRAYDHYQAQLKKLDIVSKREWAKIKKAEAKIKQDKKDHHQWEANVLGELTDDYNKARAKIKAAKKKGR